jgi:hypothetical protein
MRAADHVPGSGVEGQGFACEASSRLISQEILCFRKSRMLIHIRLFALNLSMR